MLAGRYSCESYAYPNRGDGEEANRRRMSLATDIEPERRRITALAHRRTQKDCADSIPSGVLVICSEASFLVENMQRFWVIFCGLFFVFGINCWPVSTSATPPSLVGSVRCKQGIP